MSKTRFSPSDAVKALGITQVELRNGIQRGEFRYLGPDVKAGQERRFGRLGMYEIAFVESLSNHGGFSRRAADAVFDHWIRAIENLLLVRPVPGLAEDDFLAIMKRNRELVKSDAFGDCYLSLLEHRDESKPQLLCFTSGVFSPTNIMDAYGWADLAEAVKTVQAGAARGLSMAPMVSPDHPGTVYEEPDEKTLNRRHPAIHVINLTSILAQADEAIASLPDSE